MTKAPETSSLSNPAGASGRPDEVWRMDHRWVLVTDRPPSTVKKEPMAIYYPTKGAPRYQYTFIRRPAVNRK